MRLKSHSIDVIKFLLYTSPAMTHPDHDPRIPHASRYDLKQTSDEEARRPTLLEAVTIDEHGVAKCSNAKTLVTTSLVAVLIQDHDAKVVPFEMDEQGLMLPLPAGTGSQIGFYIGHHSGAGMAAVVREGDYPGIPFFTQGKDVQKEMLLNMGGMKEDEQDAITWAEQIGLYDILGFVPSKTRSTFAKSNREIEYNDVTKNRLQIMTYGTQPLRQNVPFNNQYGYGGVGEASKTGGTRGLGVGFGNEYLQRASTSGIELTGLKSAFQISIVPQIK